MNLEQATAKEIAEKTGISLKAVRNCLLVLQDSGKVVMTKFGLYRAVRSFYWDRATLVGTIDDGYVGMMTSRCCIGGVRRSTKVLKMSRPAS